jgi:esterase/lipase superfamily enzyme
MQKALQQMALVDSLLTNWDVIRLRMEPISAALAAQLNELGQRLKDARSIGEVARAIDDLLDLTRDTAAGAYVRELVARSSLGDTSSTRGPGTLKAVNPDLEAMIETPLRAQESSDSLGTVLKNSSALPIGVEQVPIFFGTNRRPSGPSATAFSGDNGDATSYGLASVTIPTGIHEIGKLETPAWWKIFADKKDRQCYFTLADVESLKQMEFAAKLEAALQAAEGKELLVFLHGFNVTFEEAALRAAQFAKDSKFRGIVLLFSWPSQGAILGYSGDEDRALSSADRLAAFLKGLENGPWKRVHLLAHSMGSRVMLAGLADNPRPALPLGQLVFAAADVYVPFFEEKFPKLQNAGKLSATSYASKKDRALLLSSLLHRGARVGIVEDIPYVTEGLESIDASAVDEGILGHGYWSGQRPLITDLRTLLNEGFGAGRRGLDQIGKYWAFPK